MLSLAWAYLRDRPLTTALNVLLLSIAVAMLILLMQLGQQGTDRLQRDAEGIDLVVGAKGSPLQLIMSSVFHIDQPTGNIPGDSIELLRRDPAVGRVVPLALGDNFQGYRIVGTNEDFIAQYSLEMAQGAYFDAPMQAVLGAEVAKTTGATLGQRFIGSHGLAEDDSQGHEHAPFTTVGILEPTGGVADRLILTSVESVWDVHGIEHDHDHDAHEHEGHDHAEDAHSEEENAHEHDADEHDADAHEEGGAGEPDDRAASDRRPVLQAASQELEPELTALLVSYRNASGAIRIPSMVNRQTELQAAVPATETARLLGLVGASIEGIRLFAWLLALTGGLAIFVALLSMARNREGDLALLRVMGASRSQVFATVIMEGVITAAMGALTGLLLAHVLIALASSAFPVMSELGISAVDIMPAEFMLCAAVIAIGAIAALIPAWRVYRLDPVHTLSRSQ